MPILAFFLGPIGRYLLIAVAVGGVFAYGRQHYINIGYQKALHAIALQDQKAVEESNVAKGDVSQCFARGVPWTWDIDAADCVRDPATNSR